MIKGQPGVQPREIEAAFDSCSLPFYGSFLWDMDDAGAAIQVFSTLVGCDQMRTKTMKRRSIKRSQQFVLCHPIFIIQEKILC